MAESHYRYDKAKYIIATRGYLTNKEFFDVLAEEGGVIYACNCQSDSQKYSSLKRNLEQKLGAELKEEREDFQQSSSVDGCHGKLYKQLHGCSSCFAGGSCKSSYAEKIGKKAWELD